jgi:hypothetical protein
VNNTEKLDDIRRRLRHIETRLAIIQRTNVIVYERVTGRAFSSSWAVTDAERKIVGDEDAMSDDEFWKHLTTQYSRS